MQELSSTQNFFGKDPIQWWIGQVTDPKKGDWKAVLDTHKTDTGEEIYSHRCRVRIIGYHDCEDDLPDKDLPLAHVLLPSNVSVTGGQGETLKYQGGEVVVGFFLDGEDAQQPVVFGTLFKQQYLSDTLKVSEYNSKKFTCFQPWTPPEVKQNMGKHQISPIKAQSGKNTMNTGSVSSERTVAQNQTSVAQQHEFQPPSPCDKDQVSKITKFVKEFIARVNGYQQVLNVYVNPIMGKIVNIDAEIKTFASKIHEVMTFKIREARSYIMQVIQDKLYKFFGISVPKPLQPLSAKATKTLLDVLFCNMEKIVKQLFKYIADSLQNMIGQVLDVIQCFIENFIGDMFSQLFNAIDSALGSILSQLNGITSGAIGSISDILGQAAKYAGILLSILECDKIKCPPTTSWSSIYGPAKEDIDDFNNILSRASLSSLIPDLPPSTGSAPNCSSDILRCGPPRIDFMGGGGSLTSGQAVVSAVGNLIGVAIDNSGFGFTSPPLVGFVDSCNNGFGSGGYAILGSVSDSGQKDDRGNPIYVPDKNGNETGVIAVTIVDPGQGYLPNTTQTTIDEDGNLVTKEITINPDTNSSGSTSYITELQDVIIKDTGFGYSDDTTITVVDDTSGAQVDVTVVNGFIIKSDVINGGTGFTSIPDLQINSDTGAGATLLPVLNFIKVQDAEQLATTGLTPEQLDAIANLTPEQLDAIANLTPEQLAARRQVSVVTVIDCIQK